MDPTPSPSLAPGHTSRAPRPLRIAFVTESYPPEINGVAVTVARVVKGLRARQHVLQLVRPRQGSVDVGVHPDPREEVLTGGMPIPMYGSLRIGFPAGRRLGRLWQAQRPDVVHIATEGPLGWSALRVAAALKLPVCSDFRTNFHAYSQFYRLPWLQAPILACLRSFHNRCHSTMVPTEALRRQLAGEGFSPLSVVARGVDTTLFSPHRRNLELRRQWGIADDEVVALYVGRLAAEKNLAVLAQALLRMQAMQPRTRLVVVGDGPARKDLQAQCATAVFTGFQTGEKLAACYASSDLFLFPSLTETFGNVTPEAMASGLAMVAFDDAAAGHLIRHHENGLLAQRESPEQFLRLATDLACNARLRARLGARARETALQLGWDNILQKIEDQYASAMAKAHNAALPRVWARAQGI